MYVSNRSEQHVYFDDFKVQITNGNILEENHYYSYGLKIAGISSKRITDSYDGLAKNNYQYQGTFNEFDEDINWNDFQLRNYDAQVGRFVQADPFDQFPSPYTGMANDPVNTIDPSGGIGIPCPGTSGFSIFMSNVVNSVINVASQISSFTGVGLSLGLAAGKAGVFIENAISSSNMISGRIMTMQVGMIEMSSPSKDPPIFWEEDGFPDIQFLDGLYAQLISSINPNAVRTDKRYPNTRFLVFHYLGSSGDKSAYDNRREARESNNGNLADRVKKRGLIDRHEVPYASTIEGGYQAITFPASASQNQAHGRALFEFYRRNNFKGGEEFWVPIPEKNFPKRIPAPVPSPKFDLNDYLKDKHIKPYGRSPFEVFPIGPGGIFRGLRWVFPKLAI